jgi:signal transduction histidine kinase/tetratricopeptide (TPR) repeat protein
VSRKIIVIVAVLFVLKAVGVQAQNLQLIDSIRNQLSNAEGKERFGLLNDLAWEYRWAYPDSTIAYAKKAYGLGQQLKLQTGLARSLNFLGVAYNYKGNRLAAFESYDNALKVAALQKDSTQIAYSNNNIGRLFFEQGLLSRSYQYFIKALSIFNGIKDSSGLAYTYQSLANLYKSQKDYVKAEANYIKAYRIRLRLSNTRDIMSALTQIGRLYQEDSQHEKALRFFSLADSAGRKINDAINLAEIKTYAAESYLSEGLLREAEAMCVEGLNYILGKQNIRMLPHAYITMGQIQLEKRDLVNAKHFFGLALEVSTRLKDLTSKMEAYYFLWKLSEKQNNFQDQLRNQNEYLIIKDSIKDLDLARQVERLQFEIDIQRKEQENELLKANEGKNAAIITQQKYQNYGLIAIVAFVSVLGIVQWLNSTKHKQNSEKLEKQNDEIQKQRAEIIRQNKKLSKRNEQLSELNHEKDTLMSIVAHDLKSPLNRLNGLANLIQLEDDLNTQKVVYVKMLKDATHTGLVLIKDLLDVHMLEENVKPNYSTFDVSVFLLEKVKEFSATAEAKSIHLNITRVQNEMVLLDSDYLGRILDNLISNAIKFSNSNTVVEISATKEKSELIIRVKDQGPGFSDLDRLQLFQKFRKLSARPTAGETSNGLGLAIVKTLVERLNGKVTLDSAPGKGSEFIIILPLNS